MARLNIIDDSQWPEVKHINSYVGLMVCLKLLIRALSFVVFTWTTVVLLGGFVSILQKEDFWSLTVITLIEIVWAGDATGPDKGRAIGYSLLSWAPVRRIFIGEYSLSPGRFVALWLWVRKLLLLAALAVHVLVHMTVLAVFVLVLWASGMFITTGLSLWRLIQHSYDNADGDPSKANMSPALRVLYTIVVAQGAVFLYVHILSRMKKKIAEEVAKEYGFEGEDAASVSGYLEDTRNAGIPEGRNLVTYAVSLMGCDKSPVEHETGTRILGTYLRVPKPSNDRRRLLIRQLIGGSAPSSQTLQEQLLEMLNSSTCDPITRECAARIVAHVARTIHLDKFPRGIQSISSLLMTFEEYHNRACSSNRFESDIPKEEDYRAVLLQGLDMIWQFAADDINCRVIGEARGLLPKIMAPLTYDLNHPAGHDAWSRVVEVSLKVMHRLTAAPGETGAKLRRDISINKGAIGAMIRMLKCYDCSRPLVFTLAILKRLDLDTQSRQDLIQILVDAFTSSESSYGMDRELAGEALAMLSSQGGSNATITLQANADAVGRLAAQVHFGGDDSACLISAAQILENLCIHYTKPDEDEHLEKLKQAMTNVVMPKVLGHILPPEEATRRGTEAETPGFSSPLGDIEDQQDNVHNNVVMPKVLRDILLGEEATRRGTEADIPGVSSPLGDIEDQQDNVHNNVGMRKVLREILLIEEADQQNNAHNNDSSSSKETLKQRRERKLQAALLSLCVTVWNTFISGDQDLSLHFDAFSLLRKLKEIVARNNDATSSCLTLIKVTCRMVIAIMKHRGSYPKQDLKNLMGALSRASKRMILVDGSTVFANGDESRTEHVRTLASLVQEASELVRLYKADELQVMAPPSVGSPS